MVSDKPIFPQVYEDSAHVAPLCRVNCNGPLVSITLVDLSVSGNPTDTQNYVTVDADVAITEPFLISGQIERSPREDTFTSQDFGPPFGLRETDHSAFAWSHSRVCATGHGSQKNLGNGC